MLLAFKFLFCDILMWIAKPMADNNASLFLLTVSCLAISILTPICAIISVLWFFYIFIIGIPIMLMCAIAETWVDPYIPISVKSGINKFVDFYYYGFYKKEN